MSVYNQVKYIAARSLPAPFYRGAHQLWRITKRAVDTIRLVGTVRRIGLPDLVITVRNFGLGDHLLCTAILRELRQRGKGRIWMMSDYPELFAGMEDAQHVVPTSDAYMNFLSARRRTPPKLVYAPQDTPDRCIPPRRHIIAELCARAGVTGSIALRPYLELSNAERARESWASGHIVIQSSVMGAKHPMLNKEWDTKRFQHVVDALCHEFEIVQLGASTDPVLEHTKDLRGVTTIRESAAILCNARLYIGGVGFLMHLARAVECPSVIVYGGREAPWQSGYICNSNLYTPVPCAPCWRWNTCDFNRKCMTDITVEQVVNAARDLLQKPRNALAVETVEVH